MIKHTAEDFARAEFARHEDGMLAARLEPESGTYPWEDRTRCHTDTEMAADPGWSIVRDAESLTAREHMEKAWEKAHETDVIPAGAAFIRRGSGGSIEVDLDGYTYEMKARSTFSERRLLDPPPVPKRPEGAEEWEDWLIEAMPHESMPDEDIALLADRIAAHLADAEDLHDATVIVGADT